MTITRAQDLLLLEPKLSNIWNEAIPNVAVEYTRYTNKRVAEKATITDHKMTDFGLMRLKGEGENIVADDPIFGGTIAYTPVRWGLMYKVTDEMRKHDLYGQVARFEKALIKSAIDLQERTAALVWNNAFGTTNADGFVSTGFDGLQLCSVSHTRLDGGAVFRNRPSTDVDLGVTGLQNMMVDFMRLVDDRGRPQNLRPQLLVINPEDYFTAKELLQSEYKPGTANNEINAIQGEGLSFMVSHYLTATHTWFAQANVHDVNFVWDETPRGGMIEDFYAEVIARKIVQGFAVGHGEVRGVWGSNGP